MRFWISTPASSAKQHANRSISEPLPGSGNSAPTELDGTVGQRNGLAATEQCVPLCIKAERIEDVRCCRLPIQCQFRNA